MASSWDSSVWSGDRSELQLPAIPSSKPASRDPPLVRDMDGVRREPGAPRPAPGSDSLSPYRLENWKRLRAPFCPYFLRSLMRESLVRNPASFSLCLSSVLYSSSAREMPCRTAPACPAMPPPLTLTRMLNLSLVSVMARGDL